MADPPSRPPVAHATELRAANKLGGRTDRNDAAIGSEEADRDPDMVVALELLEATMTRLRGQRFPCHPAGDEVLLAAAQTLVEVMRDDRPQAGGKGAEAEWAAAWRRYLDELGRVAPAESWPTTRAVSQASRDRMREVLYPLAVAGFRARENYAWVPLAELPAPLSPFRCGHYRQFEHFLARREQKQQRRSAWTALRRLLSPQRRATRPDPHLPRRLAGADFVCWLRESAAPPCDWHRTGTDWARAVAWSRRCWDDPELTWTESAVRAWIDGKVPAELRAATTSLFCDPIVWAGPGWDLGNGQTRFLALAGAGVSSVIVSRT